MLSTVVGRFTTSAQLEKFEAFLTAEEKGLGDLHASLVSAVTTAKNNLEWDDKYMTEFIKHLHEINSATTKLVSLFLSAFTLLSLYMLN